MEDKPVRKSIKKRLLRIVLNVVLVSLSIPFALTFLFRDPMVQTFSGRMATSFLSSRIDYEIKIESININIEDGIILNGILLNDHKGIPMIKVDRLSAKPRYLDIGLFGLRFRSLNLKGAVFRYGRYIDDEEFNLMMFIKTFSSGDTTKVVADDNTPGFKLTARKLQLTNSAFHLYDEHRIDAYDSEMNYADMLFDSINLYTRDFGLYGDSLNILIDSLTTKEKSGLDVQKMSTHFIISKSGLHAQNLLLETKRSSLDLDLSFALNSYKTFLYFIDSVEMTASVRPSELDLSNIGYFADQMNSMPNKVGVTGKVKGTISKLSGRNIKIHYGDDTRLWCDISFKGLPDFFTSHIEAEIHELTTTSCALKSFKLPGENNTIDYTNEFACQDEINIQGRFSGSYYDFKSHIGFTSKSGSVRADVDYKFVENDTIIFTTQLVVDSFRIGKILHQEDILDKLNMTATVSGNGNNLDDIAINAGARLTNTDLLDYNYSRIRFDGFFHEDTLEANIRVGDRNLMMSAKGYLSFAGIPALSLNADIKKANLKNLKFYSLHELSIASQADIFLQDFDLSKMTGHARLKKNVLAFNEQIYQLDYANIEKYIDESGRNVISLDSEIAELNMTGKYNISVFADQVIALIDHFHDIVPKEDDLKLPPDEYAEISVDIKESQILEEQFLPGLALYPPFILTAKLDFENQTVSAKANHQKMVYQGIDFRSNLLEINTENKRFNLNYNVEHIVFKDSTEDEKTVFGLDNFSLIADAGLDSLAYGIHWNNHDSILLNSGDVEGYLTTNNDASNLKITKSDIYVNDTLWTIDPGNLVVLDSSGTSFKDMDIHFGNSRMFLEGVYPKRNGDSLSIAFIEWNLSNFNIITKLMNAELKGSVNGYLDFSMANNNPTVVSDVTIGGLTLNKEYIGETRLLNTWDNVNSSIYIKSEVVREGNSGKGEVISLQGNYYPFKNKEALDLDFSFNRFKLKAIEPIIAEYISDLEGLASGQFNLSGTMAKPVLIGKMELSRTALRVNYLNTKYSFSNEIKFEPDQIRFDELVIYDTLGNPANVAGSLKHNYFSDSEFDVKITTDKLLFFNTTRKMNDLYYGSAITSGNILISGSPKDIHLDMEVLTKEGTNVTLPLDYSVEISDKDYILFVEHLDSTEILFAQYEKRVKELEEKMEYDLSLNLAVTPQASISIFLPADMGRIESQGKGDLFIRTNSAGDFTLRGDYTVEEGSFHFSLANLISKKFEIVRGGRISWTGDPYRANVNIKGLYQVKTSLTSLGIVVDSTSNYRNKVNVDCYVILKNELLNPDLRFEIKMPDLDPDLQRLVYAELDTSNQASLNQQIISLLVLGTFGYSNASNVNMGTAYYSVVTNQLSSMLSKISDDFDIGVNYKPGDNVSQEEFEVALSTQLFDDRLIIDGHFGMTYDRSQQNASNIVGDVDVGYKLTKDGRWILKAFNHSNVNSWYYSSNYEKISPYTQGVGIAFRKEFTAFGDLFKRTRPRKEKNTNDDEKNDEKEENDQ